MDWTLFGAQWLHVILGIFWFGGTLYADIVMVPALSTLPLRQQRDFGAAIGARGNLIIPAVALGAILMGVLRGTVWGQVRSLDALTTTYGLTWLVGLVAAAATFAWGYRVIKPALERLATISDADALSADGAPSPTLVRLLDTAKRVTLLELVGFLVVFTCMILMRFGY
ncbi:MAG TPA: hypothetical protein VFR93_03915 [Candidatus Limnocylindrales bacterium]|nr:hypothetical protein [Candidatus Limnocylindrales bacterium]